MFDELFLILDTNTLVHYRPFNEIDWCKTFSAKRVRLLIPLIVLDELDRIKNEHKHLHIRRRAQTIADQLDDYIDEKTAQVRRFVEIDFLEEADETDKDNTNLDYNDDKIIKCVRNLQNRAKGKVILVTHDSGLTRRAKMRGLKTGKLPSDYKIEFVDESDKKYKELEQKHRKLEKAAPNLSIAFEIEEQKIERTLQPRSPFPSFADLIAFNALKQEYGEKIKLCQTTLAERQKAESAIKENGAKVNKLKLEMTEQTATEISRQLEKFDWQLNDVPTIEFIRFINESNRFLQEYWNYLEQKSRWQNFWRSVLEIKLVISNDGLKPAQEVETSLSLPNDLDVFFLSPKQFPAEPLSPLQPVSLRIGGEIVGDVIKNVWNWASSKKKLPVDQPAQIVQPQTTDGAITVLFSKNLKQSKIKFKKLKHTQKIMLPPLYLRFNNFKMARSFHFDYELLADNTPEKEHGRLHLIINKPLILSLLNFGGGI